MEIEGLSIEWLGQAGFRLKGGGKTIYIDPYNISPENSGEKADIILITHDHYDHCDSKSIDIVKKEDTIIFAPQACAEKIQNVRTMNPGDSVDEAGIKIVAVHAYNINKEFHPKGKGIGLILTVNNKTIYHAGDTDKIPEMKNLGNIDIAMLPVGGTYTMTAEEAAEALNDINPKIAIPMHYGSVVGSKEDAEKFKELAKCEVKIL